ncbi:MAG: helix-turn-helix transcriptional regulator [Nakamurella sp.]
MRNESRSVGAFLRARRESMQPEDVGLTRGPHRRVSGLRREEVARLADISAEYYLRLEQGRDHQPSTPVLTAIGRALQLDDDGLRYLHRLAYPPPQSEQVDEGPTDVPDGIRELLAQWASIPAYVSDRNHFILAANELAMAMAPGFITPGTNMIAQVFAGAPEGPLPEAWENTASSLVASLRFQCDLNDKALQRLVGALSIRSNHFRRLWATHDARPLTSGHAANHIEPFGWLNFRWQTLDVPGGAGQQLTVLFGDAGSPEVAAIAYLSAKVRQAPAVSLVSSPRQVPATS